jgi:hypothetical protein
MTNTFVLVFIDVLILGGLFLLGYVLIRAILGKVDLLAILCLSIGLGGGLLSWSLFVISWAGVELKAGTIFLVFAFLTLLFAGIAWRTRASNSNGKQAEKTIQKPGEVWFTRGIWIITGLLILAVVYLAVGLSYFGWDDISNWAVKGYGIALQGTIFAGKDWGMVGLSYPMNLPLLIALFRIIDGDALPGSKLLFPLFYAGLLIGCYRFWILNGLKQWSAALGTLLLASTPILFTHAYMGYANLPFTFYLIMGILWCVDGLKEGGSRKILLGGILLAFALWTRPEGIAMVAGIVAALWFARILTSTNKRGLLILIIPLILVGIPWLIFLKTHPTASGQGYDLAGLAIKGILAGQFHWSAFYTIFRYIAGQMLRFLDWGILPMLVGLMFILKFRPRRIQKDVVRMALLSTAMVLGVILIGLHYMAAFQPGDPGFLYEWLSLDFTRVAMPVGLCLTILGFLILEDDPIPKPISD